MERSWAIARIGALGAFALVVFVLALELLKTGAGSLGPLPAGRRLGLPGGVGLGWLAACFALSGSPVAAVALTLLAAGTLCVRETLGVVAGSRLGASFVVLLVGAVDDYRHARREKRSAYVGVVALLTTAAVYAPALALAALGLESGVFAGLRLEGRDLSSLSGRVYGPLLLAARAHAPAGALFAAGVLLLLGSFRLFDRALPDLRGRDLASAGRVILRPPVMFAAGLLVTAATLSVSVSLSLLVPLAGRGYVRRENAWPYILGANITTFVDTLFVGALVGHPEALRVVALLVAAVTALSLPVVFVFPHAFERLLDRLARRATASGTALLVFVALLLLLPALLLVL